METLANIDPKTQELLVSSVPDLDYLTRRKSSRASNEDAKRVLFRARDFILEKGTPPWDRLNIKERAFMVAVNPQNNAGPQIVYFKQFSDDIAIIRGKLSKKISTTEFGRIG